MTCFSLRALQSVSYTGVPQAALKVWTLALAVSVQCPRALCLFPSLALLLFGQGTRALMRLSFQQWMMWGKAAVHLSDEHFDFIFFNIQILFVYFYVGWQELFVLWDLDKEETYLLIAFTLLSNWVNPSDKGLIINPKMPRIIFLGF